MTEPTDYPARWWHKTDDGRVQCDLCPRDCKLNEGQRVNFDEEPSPKGPRAGHVRGEG